MRVRDICRLYGVKGRVAGMLLQQDWACPLCGKRMHPDDENGLNVDHIQPISRGGLKRRRQNMQLVHRNCNQTKGDMTEPEFRAWRQSGLKKRDWLKERRA